MCLSACLSICLCVCVSVYLPVNRLIHKFTVGSIWLNEVTEVSYAWCHKIFFVSMIIHRLMTCNYDVTWLLNIYSWRTMGQIFFFLVCQFSWNFQHFSLFSLFPLFSFPPLFPYFLLFFRSNISETHPLYSKMADNITKPFCMFFTENSHAFLSDQSSSHLKIKNKNNETSKINENNATLGLGVILALRQIRKATKALQNLLKLQGIHKKVCFINLQECFCNYSFHLVSISCHFISCHFISCHFILFYFACLSTYY